VVTKTTPTPAPTAGFTFADEFAGAAGSYPSAANWAPQTGQGIWGTGEVEMMTSDPANAYLNGTGQLVIACTSDGQGGFNSARLQSTFSQQFGTWEICAKINPVAGGWPAVWFMGNNGQWPANGEADMMENYGPTSNNGQSQSTVHSSGSNGNPSQDANFPADDAWHIYKMVWAAGRIEFYRDGVSYLTVLSSEFPAGQWPFDDNGGMYCILNVAAGGEGTNYVNPEADVLPVLMEIDYVHCWA
jgi:beta-glucanase (GH16 family)